MKKIGLLGGISWVSTIDYYRYINEGVNKKLGGLNFAECVIYSLNFGDIQRNTWENAFELLLNGCKELVKNNVDAIVLCANAAHLYADEISAAIDTPIIHVGEVVANAIVDAGIKKVGLIGTIYTMEKRFYLDKLEEKGIEVIVPERQETRDYIQQTLKEELGRGVVKKTTKENYINIAKEQIAKGAKGIILGCTEIPLLINERDLPVPIFDTTKIHTKAIVDFVTL